MITRFFRKRHSRLVDEGREAYAAGDVERSIELLQAARLAGARDPEALQLLGVACGKVGRHDAAREAISEALGLEFKLRARDDAATAAALVDMLWTQPWQRWRHRLPAIERLGWLYSRTGAYEKWGDELVRSVARRNPADLAPGNDEDAAYSTLRLLAFTNSAAPVWIESVFVGVLWPWMRQALAAGRYGLGLMLETQAYGGYVVKHESEEHFRRAFSVWTDAMREAGRSAGEALSPLPTMPGEPLPAIAFYLHSGGVLAHTLVLLEFLEAHAGLDRPIIRPLVFVRGLAQNPLMERLAAIGTPCYDLEKELGNDAGADFRAMLLLRGHIAAKGVSAVVWVSIAVHMAFAFSMRVAPVQIWWALKYHSLQFPEIDGYLTAGSAGRTKRVAGTMWRSSPLASENWYRGDLAARAAEVRSQYAQYELLFACLGREEKLASEPFLATLGEILKACPRAGFLWTGRERSPAVQSALERLGVAQRCHFIGWVDTKLFAQVLDVFLDSFPFPCGFTLYEAMAAAKPVIVYASPEASETGVHGLIGPLLAGETGTADEQQAARSIFGGADAPHYLCAATPEQYAALAVRAAQDRPLRAAAGAANRSFVSAFLSDRGRMARTLAAHLVELIAAQSQK